MRYGGGEAGASGALEERARQRKDIQTVILGKSRFKSRAAAVAWLRENEFRTDKIDEPESGENYRARQFDPGQCKEGSQRTIEITSGVQGVICARKGARAADGPESLELPMLYRVQPMDARAMHEEEDEDDEHKGMRFDVSVSSEAEIERSMFGLGSYVEVLSHADGAVDLARLRAGAPVLVEHDSRDQVGVVESARIQDRTLRAVIRFSRNSRGAGIARDVEDGIRRNLSVGYLPRKMKLEEEDKDRKKYRVTHWQPGEISVVSIPADITVGFNRSAAADGETYPVEIEPADKKGENAMSEQNKPGAGEVGEGGAPKVEVSPETQARLDAAEIQRMCDANKMGHRAQEFLKKGFSVAQVSHEILTERKTEAVYPSQPPEQPKGDPADDVDGLSRRERQRYSYVRALRIAAGAIDKTAKFDGLEAEVHNHLVKHKPDSYQARGGIFVPLDLRTVQEAWDDRERRELSKRALDSKTLAKGAEAVFDVPGELIELLRARAAVISLGARNLTGLSGPVAFPKQTGAMTAYWVGENPASGVTASDLALGLVVLQPKTLQATTSYSRQLLAQANVDIENLVRNDLAMIHALAIDKAALHGLGVAGEPTGIYVAPDVLSLAAGGPPPTYANLVDMIGKVADANATLGTLGWITTPLLAAKFRQTPEHSTATMAGWIWQGSLEVGGTGTIAGYRAVATGQVGKTLGAGADEHGLIFGNWDDLLIGLFGALEIVVDPYAQKKSGMIEVTSFQMTDLVLRHGQSFCKATGAKPA